MKFYYLKNGILCICTTLILIISGCKKGEDDPAISFASRKARVVGEWQMKSAHVVLGIKKGGSSRADYTYDYEQTTYRLAIFGRGYYTGSSGLSMVFKKDGGYSIKQKLDTASYTASGKWDFQGKVGHSKNKEIMTIKLESVSGESNLYALFNKSVHTFSYRIKELRKHKMVLVSEGELIAIDQTGTAYYVTSEYIFED